MHQGTLSCVTEAGAAIPEHADHPWSISSVPALGALESQRLLPSLHAAGSDRRGRRAAGATCHGIQSSADSQWHQISYLSDLRFFSTLLSTVQSCCDVLQLTEQPCAVLLSMSWLHFYLSALIRCFLAQAHVFSHGKTHFFLPTKARPKINHLSTVRLAGTLRENKCRVIT